MGPVLSRDLLFLARTVNMQATLGSVGTGALDHRWSCQAVL